MARRKNAESDSKPDEGAARMISRHDFIEPETEPAEAVALDATEAGEVPAAQTDDEVPATPPLAAGAPHVPLKVFAKIAGPKWDQMAGFIHYAKVNMMGPRPVLEWRAAHQAFLQKPVR